MAEALGAECVLMDIAMPVMDGLEAAHHLAGLAAPPAVIFCTAFDQHALAAFEAAAVDYLFYSGYVALAFWWAKAVAAAEEGSHPADFKTAKRETARFYFARILPRTRTHVEAMLSGANNLMDMAEENFALGY